MQPRVRQRPAGGAGEGEADRDPPDRGWVLTWVCQLPRWAGPGLRRRWRDGGLPPEHLPSHPLLIHTGTGVPFEGWGSQWGGGEAGMREQRVL